MDKVDETKNSNDLKAIFDECQITSDEDPNKLLILIRDKLYNMLCSPMKEDYTLEAFKWVGQLCISIGDFSWISPTDEWSHEDAKKFSYIARLSLNEMHILLPLLQRHLTCGDEPEIVDGRIMVRSATIQEYEVYGNHLVIAESIIKSLLKDQSQETDSNHLVDAMKSDELKTLLERLKETMQLICDYLELVHRSWKLLVTDRQSPRFACAEGSLRLISVWLSEDPGSFREECKKFLIDLILKSLQLEDRLSNRDLLVTSLHSVCTSCEELSEHLKNLPEHEVVLEEYLRFVESEKRNCDRRAQKLFKLRCGLVKDLINFNT